MFQPRTYRNFFNAERFSSFTLKYRETDLWIGTDPESYNDAMAQSARNIVVDLRRKLDDYILSDPEFMTALVPHITNNFAPEEAKEMALAAARAGIGPMSAVAGLFSEKVGQALLGEFKIRELIVENGGDIFLKLERDLMMSVFAGNSPLSEKIAVKIPADTTPLGVCTSSGTVGPSLSFGIADAAMVACKSTVLADAFATAFGNKVKSPDVIEDVLNDSHVYPEIISIILICRDKLGIRGKFDVIFQ